MARDGGKPVTYALFQTRDEQVDCDEIALVQVAPGESARRSFWLLLGRRPKGTVWGFLLPATGAYRVAFLGLPGAEDELAIEVVVQEPLTEEDDLALRGFSVAAASVFLGESRGKEVGAGVSALKALVEKHPRSRYAAYAAFALAEHLWRTEGGFEVDFKTYKEHLDLIIEKHPGHPLREEALYLLVRGYVFQRGKKKQAAQVAARLAAEYPGSPFIDRIESESGIRPGQRFPETTKPKARVLQDGPASVEFVGLDRPPDGPRQTYETYWRQFASRRLDEALGCLHRGFVGDRGNRARQKRAWERAWQRAAIRAIRVEVLEAKGVETYRRPRTLGARERTWTGELCQLTARVSFTLADPRTGAARTVGGPPIETVMLREHGQWLIVCEHVDTPNQRASLLAGQLGARLRRQFSSATVYDGQRDICLHDMLRKRLAGGRQDAKLSWRFVALTMTGPRKDTPEFVGEVTAHPAAGVAPATSTPAAPLAPSRHTVTLSFALDGERLRLTGIDVRPAEGR